MSRPIAELAQGQTAEMVCLLANKQIAQTKAGKPYGACVLADRSGQVDAKLWDRAEEILDGMEPGQVVKVIGRVEAWNGRPQVVIQDIAPQPEASAAEFMPASPHPPAQLWQRLTEVMLSVKHRRLKRVLKSFFEDADFHQAFGMAPAAKGAHHAYVHGLLEHTAGVGELALKIATQYPELDRDMLIAGALLHDVGKVQELTLGPPLDYTDAGRLEGHLVLGVRMLDARLAGMKGFPEPLAAHLRHMLLSHHGLYEFGSPRRPKTPEAFALNMIDDLDAKLAMLRGVREAAGPDQGNWSPYNRLLERFIYVGPSPLEPPPSPSESPQAPEPDPIDNTLELFK